MYLALAEAEWVANLSEALSPDPPSAAQLTVRSVFSKGRSRGACAQEVGGAAVWIASSSTPALDDTHNS
jgi:hypothetical protein